MELLNEYMFSKLYSKLSTLVIPFLRANDRYYKRSCLFVAHVLSGEATKRSRAARLPRAGAGPARPLRRQLPQPPPARYRALCVARAPRSRFTIAARYTLMLSTDILVLYMCSTILVQCVECR